MRTIKSFSFFLSLFYLFSRVVTGDVQAYEPKIFVQYHLWFTTEDVRPDNRMTWAGWSQTGRDVAIINGVDPTHFVTPWRRATYSRLGLPLTGPYSSQEDLEVVRYHFQLAKQAGIDGMFASVYDGEWVPIFKNHLMIAGEVGIKIAQELYHGVTIDKAGNPEPFTNYPTRANGCKIYRTWLIAQMTNAIKPYKNNPAFLRIEGKPAVKISNGPICSDIYPNNFGSCSQKWREWFPRTDCPAPPIVYSWGDADEMGKLLAQVEQNVGESIYVVLWGDINDYFGKSYASIPQIGKITTDATSNFILFWNLFGERNQISVQLGEKDRLKYEQEYQSRINNNKSLAGEKFSLQVNSSFDERGLFPTNANKGSNYSKPRAIITRDGNGMYEKNDGFLKAALTMARKNNLWVFVDSWNDWGEQHQLEPGFAFNNFLYHRDYFSALRRVAEFKGIANPNFSFPHPSLLDPPLVKYCRHKQFSGQKVKLKGKFGFGKNASPTNGVILSVSYINDYLSKVDPSWEKSTNWEALASLTKKYDGQLKSFEFDITQILDTPAIVFGLDSNGDPGFDQVYFTELKLDWYGSEVDLLDREKLAKFNWHSLAGTFNFGQNSNLGCAYLINDVLLEDGNRYSKALFLAPNWNTGGDTFVHAGIDWMKFEPFIPQCRLDSCPQKPQGDADCNGKTNLLDFNQWLGVYTRLLNDQAVSEEEKTNVDFNNDARVDLIDFSIWLKDYQRQL